MLEKVHSQMSNWGGGDHPAKRDMVISKGTRLWAAGPWQGLELWTDLDPPGERAGKVTLRFGSLVLLILADTYKMCLFPLSCHKSFSKEAAKGVHSAGAPGKMGELWGTGQSAGSAP